MWCERRSASNAPHISHQENTSLGHRDQEVAGEEENTGGNACSWTRRSRSWNDDEAIYRKGWRRMRMIRWRLEIALGKKVSVKMVQGWHREELGWVRVWIVADV